MKRKRELEDKNHFLPVIIQVPEILYVILDFIDIITDLLSFYRVLYPIFYDNNNILLIMERNLICYDDYLNPFNNFILDKEIREFWTNKDTNVYKNCDRYIEFIQDYKQFRFTRNFYYYGLCVFCSKVIEEVGTVSKVTNFNEKIESEYIACCLSCYDKENGVLWLTPEQLIKELDPNYLCQMISNKFNVRSTYDNKDLYFKKDLNRINYLLT
jgi:hypothetical protein